MIKKIAIFITILMIYASPALADDGGGVVYDYEGKVTYQVKAISEDVQIGEKFYFTLIATNNTSYDVRVWHFQGIFRNEYIEPYQMDDIKYPYSEIVPAHSSVELDYSYIVPTDIHWHKRNGKFYVKVNPSIRYFALDLPEDADYGDPIYEGWTNNGYDTISECQNTIYLEVTNIHDGREIAELDSTFGENAYYCYYESADDTRSYGYSVYTTNESSLLIQNTGKEPFEYICSNGYIPYSRLSRTGVIETITINTSEVYDTQREASIPRYPYDDLPKKVNVSNSILLQQDGKYYGLYSLREVPTIAYNEDSVKFEWEIQELNDAFEVKYTVLNNSGMDLYNFILVKDIDYNYDITKHLDKIEIIPVFRENEVITYEVQIPKNYNSGYSTSSFSRYRIYGWQISDKIFLFKGCINYKYKDSLFTTVEQNRYTYNDITKKTKVFTNAYYYDSLSIDKLSPSPTQDIQITPTPTSTVTSSLDDVAKVKETPRETPHASATEDIQFLETRIKRTIPIWAWILLVISIVVTLLLIFILSKKKI